MAAKIAGTVIHVTLENIANGEQENPSYCPIALAVRKQLRTADCAVYDQLEFDDAGYALPATALKFIARFDHGDDVKPFSFRIGRKLYSL